MAGTLPRFEADIARFERAEALSARRESSTEGSLGFPEPVGERPRLRIAHHEGLDPGAVMPPPGHDLSLETAVDTVPDPEASSPADPAELAESLSESVPVPDDWRMVAQQAGGTPLAHCLRAMLDSMGWVGGARQVAEALPRRDGPLMVGDVAGVFDRLGFTVERFRARLWELGPGDLPALFVTAEGDAMVLRAHDQGGFAAFDGATQTLRPMQRNLTSGEVFRLVARPAAGARPDEGAKDGVDLPIAADFWDVIRPRRWALGVLTTLQAVSAAAVIWVITIALDHAIPSASLPILLFYGGVVLICAFAEVGFKAWRDRIALDCFVGVRGQLDRWGIAQVFALPAAALLRTREGARRMRQAEVESLASAEMAPRLMARLDLGFATGLGLVMVMFAGWLVLIPAVAAGLMLFVGYALAGSLRRSVQRWSRAADDVADIWFEGAKSDDSLKNAAAHARFFKPLSRRIGETMDGARSALFLGQASRSAARAFTVAGAIASGLAAAWLALVGTLSTGEVAALLVFTWWVLRAAVGGLAPDAGDGQRALRQEQVRSLARLAKERPIDEPPPPSLTLTGHVDVTGLSTAHPDGVEASLDGIAFHARPGEVVVLVGDYRSGKSSMLRILAGMAQADGGNARLDGTDVRAFDPLQLRQAVSYVPEQPDFLPLSLGENLRLADPLADEASMQQACHRAGVMEQVRVLEAGAGANRKFGLAVETADLTVEPAPGFFKKLALARGYIRPTALYLLDGPERGLDPEGEQALIAAIEDLREQATLVIATDRPSLIRLADRVVWLDTGRIRAAGPSDEVLERLYAAGQMGQTLPAS